MIHQGPCANPVAGTGRPRDAVREKLLAIAQGKGLGFLGNLMDGKVQVSLVGTCPKCSYVGKMPEMREIQEIVNKVTASVDQRLKGNEQALKYGLGSLKEVSTEAVRERVQQTLDIIRQHVTPEQSLAIFAELRPIWV